MFMKVWGPTVARDEVLRRVSAVRIAIKETNPLLLEEVLVVENVQQGQLGGHPALKFIIVPAFDQIYNPMIFY